MVEDISKKEKSDYYRTHYYQFEDRLVLKVVGKRSFILQFLKDLHNLYPSNKMNVSPIKGDNINPTCSCFINIFYDLPPFTKQNKDEEAP
jgi:hypothetical protein